MALAIKQGMATIRPKAVVFIAIEIPLDKTVALSAAACAAPEFS